MAGLGGYACRSGRATGSARRSASGTCHKGKFTRLAMTGKEATQWLLTGVACYVIVWKV